jgi:hypothetical protein
MKPLPVMTPELVAAALLLRVPPVCATVPVS